MYASETISQKQVLTTEQHEKDGNKNNNFILYFSDGNGERAWLNGFLYNFKVYETEQKHERLLTNDTSRTRILLFNF